MEELQYRPQITAQRDWGVVPSRGDALGLESIRTELSSVDPWQTSVAAQYLCFHTN
jgi:hypothetical protein